VPGGIFPDYELPDHTGTMRKLSELQGDDPLPYPYARPLLPKGAAPVTPPSKQRERYLGCKQRFRDAVNVHIGLEPDASS
jgi:hypothetical protein